MSFRALFTVSHSAQQSAYLYLLNASEPHQYAIRTEPVTSPIQSLDLDVLWHIFDINANIFDDDKALETTLATSYVCHDWRSLLLNSTSIWAHVINLDHWQWGTVEGSRELIRRSGRALLWIKTHTGVHDYWRQKKQIPNIMETFWNRIQMLEVTIYDDDDFANQCAPLCRPTLHLESIRIIFDHRYLRSSNIWSCLFSGDAPMLCDLLWKGYGLNNIPPISWLRQVRCMKLSTTLTVSAILRALESTVSLTDLRLDLVEADNRALTLPFVSLPKLAYFDLGLADKFTPGAVLLEHMYIPPSCAVILSARQIQQGELDKESTFRPIISAISTCAQRCLSYYLPQRLQVIMTPTSFLLEATHRSLKPYFLLHIKMASQVFRVNTIPGETHAALLKEFSKPSLSKVTHFEVRMFRTLRDHVPGLAVFISCLPSVDTLVTDKPFLLYLGSRIPQNGGNKPRSIPFLRSRFSSCTPPHFMNSIANLTKVAILFPNTSWTALRAAMQSVSLTSQRSLSTHSQI